MQGAGQCGSPEAGPLGRGLGGELGEKRRVGSMCGHGFGKDRSSSCNSNTAVAAPAVQRIVAGTSEKRNQGRCTHCRLSNWVKGALVSLDGGFGRGGADLGRGQRVPCGKCLVLEVSNTAACVSEGGPGSQQLLPANEGLTAPTRSSLFSIPICLLLQSPHKTRLMKLLRVVFKVNLRHVFFRPMFFLA